MSTSKSNPTVAEVLEYLSCDDLTKRNGVFTARRGFFYSSGGSSQKWADEVAKQLGPKFGIEVIDHGEKWMPFKGGASTRNQSHWWVTFEIFGVR